MHRAWLVSLLLLACCSETRPNEVLIKGGTFTPGNDASYPEEARGAPVTVGSFMMDATEVTNAAFAAFVQATGYVTVAEKGFANDSRVPKEQQQPGGAVFLMPEPGRAPGWTFMPGANWRHPEGPGSSIEGKEDEPVVQIAYADALAYAKWKGRDLPTEAEWEWAAGQGRHIPGRDRPIIDGKPAGNNWDGTFPTRNNKVDGYLGRAPVGRFPADMSGLYDMTGNVWEWTRSGWTMSHRPGAPAQPGAHAIKGGSYLCARNFCARYRPQSRQMQDDTLGTNHVGFRTIKRLPNG